MTKHLYIHLPFCKNICTYCDFVRIQQINPNVHKTYLDLILAEVQNSSCLHQYQTIYLGGGTPNVLNDANLTYLLSTLVNYLDLNSDYEFCIELNPDSVTKSQVAILKQYKINRVSLGVQTTNDAINLFLHRYSKLSQAIQAIK
ncbi:radical SAM protein [bacterium]|nr:radical SAM protein [bacterium]